MPIKMKMKDSKSWDPGHKPQPSQGTLDPCLVLGNCLSSEYHHVDESYKFTGHKEGQGSYLLESLTRKKAFYTRKKSSITAGWQ